MDYLAILVDGGIELVPAAVIYLVRFVHEFHNLAVGQQCWALRHGLSVVRESDAGKITNYRLGVNTNYCPTAIAFLAA